MKPSKEYPKVVRVGSVGVKIYRNKHARTASGWIFQVAWVSASGRRISQFTDEAAALEEARLKATQLAAGRIEGAEMGRSDRDELQAARVLAGDVPVLAALDEWRKARALAGGNLIPAVEAWAGRSGTNFDVIDIKTAVERFFAAKKSSVVDVTSSYNKILPSFVAAHGERSLHTLSSRDLAAWMEKRYPHPVTRNTARQRLVTLWRWARKQGYLQRDAMTEAEQTDAAREEPAVIGTITHKTFAALLNFFRATYPDYLAALVIAGFCGVRMSEVHGQLWSDINLERKFLRVTKAKRNTPAHRLVAICPAGVEWLKLCKNREGHVCQTLNLDRIREIGRHENFTLPENCFRHSSAIASRRPATWPRPLWRRGTALTLFSVTTASFSPKRMARLGLKFSQPKTPRAPARPSAPRNRALIGAKVNGYQRESQARHAAATNRKAIAPQT